MLFTVALQRFLDDIQQPNHQFADSLAFIEHWFNYHPSAFSIGQQHNLATENQGSCKIFALAQLLSLTQQQALLCFGEHSRNLPLLPQGSHLNLRQLAKEGLSQIQFEHFPLQRKEE